MRSPTSSSVPPLWAIIAAFATIYIVWGSTYLAIRFAVETLPPLLMAGTRFLLAGILLFAFLRLRDKTPLTAQNWRAAALIGGLLLVCGNGLVCWSEQYVASGSAALLVATVPLWMVALDWLFYSRRRPAGLTLLGLLIGSGGIYLLIGPAKLSGERIDLLGGLALVAACAFWALGSLHSRRVKLPKSAFLSTAMEMIAAGVLLLVLGTALGEWPRVHFTAISAKSLWAFAYLISIGSIVALTAYVWLLQVCSPALVSTYAYVNPVIAVLLGTLFANEPLTARTLVAAAIIVFAVVLITTAASRRAAQKTAPASTDDAVGKESREGIPATMGAKKDSHTSAGKDSYINEADFRADVSINNRSAPPSDSEPKLIVENTR